MRVDWSYIAGFFDGEGCVQHRYGSAIVSITQKRVQVLENIKVFLASHGIIAGISTRKKSGVSSLYITRTTDTLKFLRELFPFLIVKKTEAQDVMRYSMLFPPRHDPARKVI